MESIFHISCGCACFMYSDVLEYNVCTNTLVECSGGFEKMQSHDFKILQFSKIDYIFSHNLKPKSKNSPNLRVDCNILRYQTLKKSIRYYALS